MAKTIMPNNAAKTAKKSYNFKSLLRRRAGLITIVASVIIANLLYITGVFNPNPLYQQSGLLSGNKPGLLRGLDTIDPNDGYTTQALGHAAARDIRHGSMPWWNYNEQVGAPLAGEMQSAALFPLTVLLGLANGLLFFHIILQAIAGLGTYYLLKKLRCSETASVVGGILFSVNGTFAWLANAAVNPVAFLPLLLLGIETAYQKSVSKQQRGWVLIAIALALSLYAGFPETAYLNGLLGLAWFITRLIQVRRGPWKQFLVKTILGGLTGILLAAPILVAFITYYPYANVGSHGGAERFGSLGIIGLPALILPYIYGPIFGLISHDPTGKLLNWWGSVGGYITLPAVLFAAIGLKSKKQKAIVILLLAWILITIARIYGLPVLSQAVNLIPGISSTAVYRYIFPSIELAIIILAAFGLDVILSRKLNRGIIISFFGVALLEIVAGVLALHFHSLFVNGLHHQRWLIGSIAWAFASIMLVLISCLYLRRYARILCVMVLVCDAVFMFVIPQLSAPRKPYIDIAPVNYLKRNIDNYRFYSLGPIAPNYGSYFGVASINTNDLPVSKDWSTYVIKHLYSNVDPILFTGTNTLDSTKDKPLTAFIRNLPAYEEVGVKFVITPNGLISKQTMTEKGLTRVFQNPTADIYTLPVPKPYFEVTRGHCELNVLSKSQVQAVCEQPSNLVRRELYIPGWQAESSKTDTQLSIQRSGEIFQATALPVGKTTITYRFSPPYILLAELASVTGLLIVFITYSAQIRQGLVITLKPSYLKRLK